MTITTCLICNKQFRTKPSYIYRKWSKYCSKPCQYQAMKNGNYFNCANCNKQIYRTQKDQLSSKSQNFFAINRVRQYGEILKYMLDQITQIGTVVNHPIEVL